MRFLQLLILLVFLGAVLIFALQNDQPVTVRFLDWRRSFPNSLLIGGVYMLGMLSGWTVVAFVSRSLRRVTESRR